MRVARGAPQPLQEVPAGGQPLAGFPQHGVQQDRVAARPRLEVLRRELRDVLRAGRGGGEDPAEAVREAAGGHGEAGGLRRGEPRQRQG